MFWLHSLGFPNFCEFYARIWTLLWYFFCRTKFVVEVVYCCGSDFLTIYLDLVHSESSSLVFEVFYLFRFYCFAQQARAWLWLSSFAWRQKRSSCREQQVKQQQSSLPWLQIFRFRHVVSSLPWRHPDPPIAAMRHPQSSRPTPPSAPHTRTKLVLVCRSRGARTSDDCHHHRQQEAAAPALVPCEQGDAFPSMGGHRS